MWGDTTSKGAWLPAAKGRSDSRPGDRDLERRQHGRMKVDRSVTLADRAAFGPAASFEAGRRTKQTAKQPALYCSPVKGLRQWRPA